ncbi:MAG: nucleotide exchange factor GrpE [Dehalococcoidia bacterium]|nr:nucleotide exchange factor GrpE [Dehalococcoidia bacterium]
MTTDRDQDGADVAGGPPDSAGGADGAQLRAQLEEEREKAKSYYQSWQRSAADFQNFKRRVEDERSETARLANAALIINMLPLLDDLERALKNVDGHLAGLTWVDGVRLIYRKFQALIEMAGAEEIAADGETFDPARHEAVSQAPGEENKVVSVVQKGYRLGDRVIRPAMVVVGRGGGGEEG